MKLTFAKIIYFVPITRFDIFFTCKFIVLKEASGAGQTILVKHYNLIFTAILFLSVLFC